MGVGGHEEDSEARMGGGVEGGGAPTTASFRRFFDKGEASLTGFDDDEGDDHDILRICFIGHFPETQPMAVTSGYNFGLKRVPLAKRHAHETQKPKAWWLADFCS